MLIHRGEILFSQGETGDFIYTLKFGLLKVVRIMPNGECLLLNVLLPGEVFPHHSLMSSKEYHATVIAVMTSEVERMVADSWYRSLEEDPKKYKEVAMILEANLRKMQKRMDLITVPSKQRIQLFREWMNMYCPNSPIEDLLTQEEIGQFLGLSRETVNRYLRKENS